MTSVGFAPFPPLGADLNLKVDELRFTFQNWVYPRCIQCHQVDMTVDTTKMNLTFERRGTRILWSERAKIMGPVDLERGRKHVPEDQTKAGIRLRNQKGGGM